VSTVETTPLHVRPGRRAPLGATPSEQGTNFAVASSVVTAGPSVEMIWMFAVTRIAS
jgi:hypothetical protein